MINAKQFRTDLPEFQDGNAYPDPQVALYINLAGQLMNGRRWGPSAADPWPDSSPPPLKVFDHGVELFVAHNLVLDARNRKDARKKGNIPGTVKGPVNNASVDKASVGYDTQAGIEENAGHWNQSTYGIRFIRLLRMMGAGALQVC